MKVKGFRVQHPKLGQGEVIDIRHRGYECLVKFNTGLTLWVKRRHLTFLDETLKLSPFQNKESLLVFPSTFKPSLKGGREVIEAFRAGIVPENWVKGWTVGRATELSQVKTWLHDQTSGTLVIKGEYHGHNLLP